MVIAAFDPFRNLMAYALSRSASTKVDEIIRWLSSGVEPDGQLQTLGFIGGQLLVTIDHDGFRRKYGRVGMWGKTLGKLEELMSTPGK